MVKLKDQGPFGYGLTIAIAGLTYVTTGYLMRNFGVMQTVGTFGGQLSIMRAQQLYAGISLLKGVVEF